tara:strand:+ start:1086 stop:1235 length:150 start_codon:yes stop_codon:yes gene_type:complete
VIGILGVSSAPGVPFVMVRFPVGQLLLLVKVGALIIEYTIKEAPTLYMG